MRSAATLLRIGALGLVLAACSKDEAKSQTDGGNEHPTPPFCELPTSCQEIAQACMPKDVGKGPVHDCHVTGMERGVEANCKKDHDSCLATCNAAPGLSDGPVEDLMALCKDGGVKDAGTVTFPTDPLVTFTSDGKDLDFELRTAPDQPIHIGPDGVGELRVSDVSSSAPVDGLDIAVTTWMPVMGHSCSPVAVKVEPKGGGVYVLSPFLASMKGACEVRLTISGARSEKAVSPTFDITQ